MSRPVVIVLLLLVSSILLPCTAEVETVKVTVLNTIDPSTYTDKYMYNTTNNTLFTTIDTSKVAFLSDALKDLDSSDDIHPVLLLSIDQPTIDLNTNESIVYAYVLLNAYGSLIVGVADVNTTDNTLINMSFFKISPIAGDVAIVRTTSDIVIEFNNIKMSIPLENYTDPKVVIFTDSEIYFNSINYVELRSLRDPPPGYILVRSGSGETTFTISASGRVSVWFDETHHPGDIDLFIFDVNNAYYNQASHTQTWQWLVSHATRFMFADGAPSSGTVVAHGSLKFVLKYYRSGGASWRVAIRLLSGDNPPSTPSPTPSQPTPSQQQPTQTLEGLLDRIQGMLGGGTSLALIVIVLVALIAIVAIARR